MEVHGGVDDGHEKQEDRYTITRFANDSRGVYKIHVTKSKSVFWIFSIANWLFIINQGSSLLSPGFLC